MSNKAPLFEDRVARIRSDTDEIASVVNMLARCQLSSLTEYDLKASSRNLVEAAAKIDAIRSKLAAVE